MNNGVLHSIKLSKRHLFCILHKAVEQIVFKLWPKEISFAVHYHIKKSIHIQFFAYKSKTIKDTVSCTAHVNGFLWSSFRWWSQIWPKFDSCGPNSKFGYGEGGFDLLRIEISEIRSHHWMRLEKLAYSRNQPSSCNIKAARVISLRRNRRVLFLNLSILLLLLLFLFQPKLFWTRN